MRYKAHIATGFVLVAAVGLSTVKLTDHKVAAKPVVVAPKPATPVKPVTVAPKVTSVPAPTQAQTPAKK